MKKRHPFLPLLVALSLGGCTAGTTAVLQTFELISGKAPQDGRTPTSSSFRYLRVEAQGRVVFMVLGYVDDKPRKNTEVWYSAKGEVLKLSGGRIVGTTGLATDWREVRLPAIPDWTHVGPNPVTYVRQRDEMPGYRFNIEEQISLSAVNVPTRTNLVGEDPAKLRWYEERVTSGTESSLNLFPALFAVDMAKATPTPIYGEQCLSQSFCISWQRWDVKAGAAE